MLRSAAALAALLVFPGILLAQEEAGQDAEQLVHTVERGETLWALARRYYENPFFWRNIYEANTEDIQNPHWIYPGQRFVIPGIDAPPGQEATVADVEVQPEEEPGPRPAGPAGVYPGLDDRTVFATPPRQNTPTPDERTSFFLRPGAEAEVEVLGGEDREYLAVPHDIFYSASWLAREGETDFPGRIIGWAGAHAAEERRSTVRPFERLRLEWTSDELPAVDDALQVVRVVREEGGRGFVVRPTGMVRVVELVPPGVVAVATNEYDRMRIGDRALPAEPFPLEPGQHPDAAEDGAAARVLGFSYLREVRQLGDVVFLDVGREHGIRVGDEFVAEVSGGGGWSAEPAARVQVVRVFESRASARLTEIVTPVLRRGMLLTIARRMP